MSRPLPKVFLLFALVSAGLASMQSAHGQSLITRAELRAQIELHNEFTRRAERILESTLGKSRPWSVALSLKFEDRPELDSAAPANDIDYTYSSGPSPLAEAGEQSSRLSGLTIDIGIDSKTNEQFRGMVADLVKRSFSGLPLKVKVFPLDMTSDESTQSDGRAPASEMDAARHPESDTAPWYRDRWALSVIIGLGVLFALSMYLGANQLSGGIARLAEGLRPPANIRAKVDAEPLEIGFSKAPPNPPGSTSESLASAKPALIQTQSSEELSKQFQQFLVGKPRLLSNVLARKHDSELGHLRVLGATLNESEKEQIRACLGNRVSNVSVQAPASQPVSESWLWIEKLIGELYALDMAGDGPLYVGLPSGLKDKIVNMNVGRIMNVVQSSDFDRGRYWPILCELLGPEQISQIMMSCSVNEIRRLTNVDIKDESGWTRRLNEFVEEVTSRQGPEEAGISRAIKTVMETKMLLPLLAAAQKMSITEEDSCLMSCFGSSPEVMARIWAEQWTVRTLSYLETNDWAEIQRALDPSEVSQILAASEMLELSTFTDSITKNLANGMGRTVIVDQAFRARTELEDANKTLAASREVRAIVARCRALAFDRSFVLRGAQASGGAEVASQEAA
jgi:hypothetical protein